MASTTWEPERFANLHKLLNESLELGEESPRFEQLKKQLEKLKPDLASLLELPAKNAQHRSELEKGAPTINGEVFKVSNDFVAEAKKLSDFLEIDEDLAATLVHKAVGFEKRFELPAGESAVLLFFGEREAKLLCLGTLFAGGANQAVAEPVRQVLESLASEVLSSTLKAASKMFPERVLAAIDELKARQAKVAALLAGPTADIPYQREVVEFVQAKLGEERRQLAMLLFGIIRDYQLNSSELIALVAWLRTSSVDDPVTLHLAVALLVALSTSAEGDNPEMAEVAALDKISHLVHDSQFLVKLNAEIIDRPWGDDGLKGLVWLQWALLALFGMKRSPGFDQHIGYREDRVESIAEQGIRMGAYRFAADYLLGYHTTDDLSHELSAEFDVLQRQRADTPQPASTSTEANAATSATAGAPAALAGGKPKDEAAAPGRYPHIVDIADDFQWQIERTLEDILSTFIGRMSSLIRRMRYSEEDAIYQAQQAEQQRALQEEQRQQQHQQLLQQQHGGYRYSRPIGGGAGASAAAGSAPAPPPEPRRDTEALFLWITLLFADRPDSGLRFWGRGGGGSSGGAQMELDDRLAVFLRWGSDCREQGMVRGYFNMLSSLACGPQASVCAHEFMSGGPSSAMTPRRSHVASNQAPLCSWAALFGALDFYAGHMRQSEPDPLVVPPEIPDTEVALLRSFLRLCRAVVRYSIVARTAIYDSADYGAMVTMFSLLGCVVPVSLKASLLETIAAFGELSADIATGDDARSDGVRPAVHEMARRIWVMLEQSQTLPTTSNAAALRSAQTAGSQLVPVAERTPRRGLSVGRPGAAAAAARGGIAYELEEVEAAVETYPEMRAFVRLVASLIHLSSRAPPLANMDRDPIAYAAPSPSIPVDLGSSYRVPGISPYVGFVLDNVLLRAEQRAYRYASEKWGVYALSLEVVERCLATLDLGSVVAAKAGGFARGSDGGYATAMRELVTHPGFEIAVRILCGSRLLDTLLHVLSVGVDTLNTAGGDMGAWVGFSVLAALRILLRVLRIQGTLLRDVVPELLESTEILGFPLNLPRSLTTLEQLLLSRQQSVVQIIAYVGALSPEVCLASVKILHILSDSAVFNGIGDSLRRGTEMLTLNRLVSMVDSSEESVRIMHGFISCLELEDDAVESQTGAQIAEAAKGFTSGLEDQQAAAPVQSIRLAIVDLLLANITPAKPAPTIAHYLLGFSLTKPASDDLPDPSQRATCLHTILDLLRRDRAECDDAAGDVDSLDPQHAALLARRPRLAERCYRLVYHLCADPVTSDVTMRYLRARENFFHSQLCAMPAAVVPDLVLEGADAEQQLYSPIQVYAQMHARAWLWRSAALELHNLVLQDSRARATLMAEWLVGDAGQAGASADDVFAAPAGAQTFLDARMRLLALFEGLRRAYRDASAVLRRQQSETEREYGATSDAMEEDGDAALQGIDVKSCVVANARGCAVFDLHALAALLRAAERTHDASGAFGSAGARQRAHTAMRRLVIACYYDNQERELFFAYASALRGWKEMAEIAATSAWEKSGGRGATAFQLLRGLTQVASENDPVFSAVRGAAVPSWWIEAPTAAQEQRHTEVLTALASTLTLCAERLGAEWARAGASDAPLPTEPLLDTWRLLVAAALTPAAQGSLQLRGNVFASLLHFLGGVRRLRMADQRRRLEAGALDALTGAPLGERLLEAASADAADAPDAWRTVAFALLDAVAALHAADTRPSRVVQFLARRNYFAAYVGALVRREDQALQATLQADPASLNALYIYEAKMALFIRLAQRADGAERLIENGVLDVLADCAFLDQRPGDHGAAADAFLPARAERFHQLLIPALNLLQALAPHIGRDNLTVWMKVARFVTQHYAVLEAILKDVAQPAGALTILQLTEAKAVTALAFYVARHRAVLDREAALAGSGHVGVASLHLPILALLPKLATSGSWARRLAPANDVERAQAQVPAAAYDAPAPGDAPPGDIRDTLLGQHAADLVDAVVQNAIAYAQAVTERPLGLSADGGARAFRPAFAWAIEHSRESDYTPSLATLVAFLRRTLARVEQARRARSEKMRLAGNAAEMATADLRQLVATSPHAAQADDLSTAQMRALASELLTQQATRIGRSITALVSAAEQALVLLWRHLSFYISDTTDATGSTPSAMALSSANERETLKSDASITLPSLLTSLADLRLTKDELANPASHMSFIQMLARRIKDLVLRDMSVV